MQLFKTEKGQIGADENEYDEDDREVENEYEEMDTKDGDDNDDNVDDEDDDDDDDDEGGMIRGIRYLPLRASLQLFCTLAQELCNVRTRGHRTPPEASHAPSQPAKKIAYVKSFVLCDDLRI